MLPEELVAREPPEARGLARDGVRLLVSDPDTDDVRHATARDLPDFLDDGDVLVVNASATINAALDGWRSERGGATEELVALHLSSPVPWSDDEHRWIVELRRLTADGTRPLLDARAGERIRLRGGGSATLVAPFGDRASGLPNGSVRLWEADLACPGGVMAYAAEFGAPIRYGYVRERWPLHMYQTMFGMEPGSAEMPSAGRPFTADVVMRLQSKGVGDRADHPAHGRGEPRGWRASVPGAIPCRGVCGGGSESRPGEWWASCRGGHHGRPRSRNRRISRRHRRAPAKGGPTSSSLQSAAYAPSMRS